MLNNKHILLTVSLFVGACDNNSNTACLTPAVSASSGLDFILNYDEVGSAQWGTYFTYIESVISQQFKPENVSITKVADIPGINKFHGGVLAPDGDIYFIPSSANKIYYLNTTTLELKSFGNFSTIDQAWNGGVLGPDGKFTHCHGASPTTKY